MKPINASLMQCLDCGHTAPVATFNTNHPEQE